MRVVCASRLMNVFEPDLVLECGKADCFRTNPFHILKEMQSRGLSSVHGSIAYETQAPARNLVTYQR